MRVNKQTTLGVFAKRDALPERLRSKFTATKFTPRKRDENEALPRTYTTHGEPYTPLDMEPVRPGANDHLLHRSRGF